MEHLDPTENQTTSAQTTISYAGFWKRLAAFVIDMIILSIVGYAINGILLLAKLIEGLNGNEYTQLLSTVLTIGYFTYFESSAKQATWGKQSLDIKVTNLYGEPLSTNEALTRSLIRNITSFGIVVAMFVFGPMPQQSSDPENPFAMFSHPTVIATQALGLATLVMYLFQPFTARKQTLYDIIAGTVVLDKYKPDQF